MIHIIRFLTMAIVGIICYVPVAIASIIVWKTEPMEEFGDVLYEIFKP